MTSAYSLEHSLYGVASIHTHQANPQLVSDRACLVCIVGGAVERGREGNGREGKGRKNSDGGCRMETNSKQITLLALVLILIFTFTLPVLVIITIFTLTPILSLAAQLELATASPSGPRHSAPAPDRLPVDHTGRSEADWPAVLDCGGTLLVG